MKNLDTFFPFYDSMDEMWYRLPDTDPQANHFIIASSSTLVPWVIRRDHNAGLAEDIDLYFMPMDNSYDPLEVHGDDANLVIYPGTTYDFIVYAGHALPAAIPSCRAGYCLRVHDTEADQSWYSEVFGVRDDVTDLIKITVMNNEDMAGIMGKIYHSLYLDTALKAPEYIREETGEKKDGIMVREKMVKIKSDVIRLKGIPEWLTDALIMLPMYDTITVSLPGGITREYDEVRIKDPEWLQESYGMSATIEIQGLYDVVVKKLNFKEMIYPTLSTATVKQGGPVATVADGDYYRYQVVFDANMPDADYTPAAYVVQSNESITEAQLPLITNVTSNGFLITTLVPCEVRWTAIKE